MNRKNLQLFFGLLVVIAFFVWINAFSSASTTDTNLHVYFLDVGQGDAEYIKTPSGNDILIDGGPDDAVLSELGRVMNFGDRKIDLVVLSHPHADHLTGLTEVGERFEIGEVWESGVAYPSAGYDKWRELIIQKNIKNLNVVAGQTQNFGDVKFSVLYPLLSQKNKTIDNLNNASVISELEYNKFFVLFLGDAEIPAQTQILKSVKPAAVVKIGHHGSANALSEDLLKIVRPSIAVIEVGAKNTYGHPAPSTISFLKSIAAQIYRTDQNGAIDVVSDGTNWWVRK